MTESMIHLRVPAATKGRLVRASRAAGMRLTDYITCAVEAYMQQQLARVAIPEGLDFSDLHLARDPDTGDVSFDTATIERIERIERESGLPTGFFMGQPEGVLGGLIAEIHAEDAAGRHCSHKPGRS